MTEGSGHATKGSPRSGRTWRHMEEMQTLEPEHDERGKVQIWRMHVLIEAGYSIELAEAIAGSDVDLHEAVGLVERGCSPDTAARILL